MADLPHRDIFVGMVAEELAKDGYFGEEINMYVFYVWDKVMETLFFEDEDDCVRAMLSFVENGALVSEYVFYKAHIDERNEQAMAAIKEAAQAKLATQENENFKKQIAAYDKQEFLARELEFTVYLERIAAKGEHIVNSVLGYGLQNKLISPTFARKWRKKESFGKWSGFAYLENEQIKYYANAYLPNTWQKWRKIRQENILAGGIISMDMANDKPIFEQKEDFVAQMRQNFDASFFAFLKNNS